MSLENTCGIDNIISTNDVNNDNEICSSGDTDNVQTLNLSNINEIHQDYELCEEIANLLKDDIVNRTIISSNYRFICGVYFTTCNFKHM